MLGSIAAILLTAMTVEPPKIPKIKVYLIMSYRGNDLAIEKVYLKKELSSLVLRSTVVSVANPSKSTAAVTQTNTRKIRGIEGCKN